MLLVLYRKEKFHPIVQVSGHPVSTGKVQVFLLSHPEIEHPGVFKKTAAEQDLANFHVDVLRAFGIGQDLPERTFPGLLDEEGDEAEYRWAVKGETTHSITIRLGIQYVQTYN